MIALAIFNVDIMTVFNLRQCMIQTCILTPSLVKKVMSYLPSKMIL